MEGEQPEPESIPSLVSRLIDDGEQFVRAELKLYRARAFSRLGELRNAIVLGFGALVLAQAILVAGLVGVVLTLRHYVGNGWATIIVVVAGLGCTGLMGWLAYRQLRKATEIKDKDNRP